MRPCSAIIRCDRGWILTSEIHIPLHSCCMTIDTEVPSLHEVQGENMVKSFSSNTLLVGPIFLLYSGD